MNEEQKALKKEILKALIDRDWSSTDLANEMGITRQYLNDLLNFRRGTVARMEQIKKILGLE
nr:MAG TPA: SOS-response transcriptional repressor [Caudoviricetes sp.]